MRKHTSIARRTTVSQRELDKRDSAATKLTSLASKIDFRNLLGSAAAAGEEDIWAVV